MVVWMGRPEDHGADGNWSYLTESCQTYEILLMVMVASIATSGGSGQPAGAVHHAQSCAQVL